MDKQLNNTINGFLKSVRQRDSYSFPSICNYMSKNWGLKLIGLILFVLLLWRVDVKQLLYTFKQFSVIEIIWLEVLSLFIVLTKALRFQVLLKKYFLSISLYKTTLIYGAGMYLSTITPGRIGGFAKVLYLKNLAKCSYIKGVYLNILDRLFDLSILILVSLIGVSFILPSKIYLMVVAVTAFTLIIMISRIKQIANFLLLIINRIMKRRFKITTKEIDLDRIFSIKLLTPWSISVIPYCLIFYQMIYIARSLGVEIKSIPLIGTLALGNLIGMIPISISGLGTRDATFIYLLPTQGIETFEAMSLSFAFFLLNNLGIMLISLIMFLIIKPKVQNV